MVKMKWWQTASVGLVGVGAVNWGLLGLGILKKVGVDNVSVNVDLFSYLGLPGMLSNTIYILVGIAGIYTLYWLFFGKKN